MIFDDQMFVPEEYDYDSRQLPFVYHQEVPREVVAGRVFLQVSYPCPVCGFHEFH
jgi:hypothetical protein